MKPMNPLFLKFAGGITRALLAGSLMPAVTWLVSHGYIAEKDSQEFIAWAAGLIVVIAWSLLSKHTEQLKLMVAAASHRVLSEQEIEDTIKATPSVALPSVTTEKDKVPVPIPSTPGNLGR